MASLNRIIDVGKPYNYQMDRGGGYVERPDQRPQKFRNESDSVSIYRVDFHKNLENARGVVPMLITTWAIITML